MCGHGRHHGDVVGKKSDELLVIAQAVVQGEDRIDRQVPDALAPESLHHIIDQQKPSRGLDAGLLLSWMNVCSQANSPAKTTLQNTNVVVSSASAAK